MACVCVLCSAVGESGACGMWHDIVHTLHTHPAVAGTVQANGKLQQVQPLAGAGAAATEAPLIRSFKDPVLGSGVVLLQLLHVLAPQLVDPAFVTPGKTAAQRQSNARYALSLADRLGCSLFLVWEDLVDPPQPRAMLVLLASLMYQDLLLSQKQQ